MYFKVDHNTRTKKSDLQFVKQEKKVKLIIRPLLVHLSSCFIIFKWKPCNRLAFGSNSFFSLLFLWRWAVPRIQDMKNKVNYLKRCWKKWTQNSPVPALWAHFMQEMIHCTTVLEPSYDSSIGILGNVITPILNYVVRVVPVTPSSFSTLWKIGKTTNAIMVLTKHYATIVFTGIKKLDVLYPFPLFFIFIFIV